MISFTLRRDRRALRRTGRALYSDFGEHGWVRTDLGSVFDTGRSVALGPDGVILVASDVYEDANAQAAAVRYTAGGVLDTTFGGDGVAVVDTPSSSMKRSASSSSRTAGL